MSKEQPPSDDRAKELFRYMKAVVAGTAKPPEFNPDTQELEIPTSSLSKNKLPKEKPFERTHADITHEELAKKEREADERWEMNNKK